MNNQIKELIRKLRTQATNKAKGNLWFRVKPDNPEEFLEWKAADLIEQLLENPKT